MNVLYETPAQFSMFIEHVAKTNQVSYIETILEYCDDNGIEYEDIAKMLSAPLKQKIYEEAQRSFSMPKTNTTDLLSDEEDVDDELASD